MNVKMMQSIAASVLVAAGTAAAQQAAKPNELAVNAGANLARGNSDTTALSAGILGVINGAGNKTTLGAEANYGESDDETTVDNDKAFADHTRDITERWYGYGNATIFRDDTADLDYRLTVGPGVGTHLVKSAATELNAELGVAYVREELSTGEKDDSLALRVAQKFSHKLSDTAKVWESVEYVPRTDDFDDYLLSAELGVEASMTSKLALRLVLQDRYDSTPALDAKENDFTLIGGISYKL